MFKQSNFEDELYHSMETSLAKNQTESNYGFNRLAKAVDLLNIAATIFDQAGMTTEAASITKIMEDLVKGLHE